MSKNKMNEQIKLPVRYSISDPNRFAFATYYDADGEHIKPEQIVAALNEADALRSMLANVTVIESKDWSISNNGNPEKLIALRQYDDTGDLLSYTHHDSVLSAYATIKPNAAAGEEGTE